LLIPVILTVRKVIQQALSLKGNYNRIYTVELFPALQSIKVNYLLSKTIVQDIRFKRQEVSCKRQTGSK